MVTDIGANRRSAPGHDIDIDIHAVLDELGITINNDRLEECPFCGNGSRACAVYDDDPEDVHIHCFSCNAHVTTDELVAEFDLDVSARSNRRPRPTKKKPPVSRERCLKEVERLWQDTRPVSADPATLEWLTVERKLDAELIEKLGLAKTLPGVMRLPWWAVDWRTRHRLILPTYDHHGQHVSYRARWVFPPPVPKGKKSLAPPFGEGSASGCVLANPEARKMLRGEITTAIELVVVEGEPDYLTWATLRRDLAVIGIWSGAWTQDIASRIPRDSTITIRTHHDEPGNKLAAAVMATLPGGA